MINEILKCLFASTYLFLFACVFWWGIAFISKTLQEDCSDCVPRFLIPLCAIKLAVVVFVIWLGATFSIWGEVLVRLDCIPHWAVILLSNE